MSGRRQLIRQLADRRRLHLSDGPIDLIVRADGPLEVVQVAQAAAVARFAGVLDELCGELALLRSAADPARPPEGPIARRMWQAVLPHAATGFITPMAAVAGAVAEEILAALVGAAPLERAFVNNGGDAALHLAAGAELAVGLVARPDRPRLLARAVVRSRDPVRGIATSGWRGRSFSLGIADAVTVLAATAAMADAAATVIANAVDLPGHPCVRRRPASDLQPDSDLGTRPVTVDVGRLAPVACDEALAAGLAVAERLRAAGLIQAAALHLQGVTRIAGAPSGLLPSDEGVGDAGDAGIAGP